MSEPSEVSIDLSIYEPAVLQDVLERVVSAMATLASMSVDRLMNALTAVDALVPSVIAEMDEGTESHIEIVASTGRLRLTFGQLEAGEAQEILGRTAMPGVGDVLSKLSTDVRLERNGTFSSLVVSLD